MGKIHADEALIIAMPLDAAMNDGLREVYNGLKAPIVKACETRRIAIEYGTATNLMQVRDILEPYKRFRAWCEAAGFVYPTVMMAIRRLEMRMLEAGETETPSGRLIKPISRRATAAGAGYAVSWGLRRTLHDESFGDLWDGSFLTWVKHQIEQGNTDIRDRCMDLGKLLLEAASVEVVEEATEADETA